LLKFASVIFVIGVLGGFLIAKIIRTKEKISRKLSMILVAIFSFVIALGFLIAFQIAWSEIWTKAVKREVRIVKDVDLNVVDESGNLKGIIKKGSTAIETCFRKGRRVYLKIPIAVDADYVEYVKKLPQDGVMLIDTKEDIEGAKKAARELVDPANDYALEARRQYKQKQYDQAEQKALKAIKEAKHNIVRLSGHNTLLDIYEATKRYELAIKEIDWLLGHVNEHAKPDLLKKKAELEKLLR